MAFSRNHAFVSGVADGGNAALLQPSYWNQALVVSGATVGGIPYCPTATSETTSANLLYTETSGPRLQIGSGAAATQGWHIGYYGSSGASAIWPTDVTPDANNFVLRRSASQVSLNTPETGSIYYGSAGTAYLRFADTTNPTLSFGTAFSASISYLGAASLAVGNGTAGSFAGSLKLTNTQMVGYAELDEMTAPSGAANSARLFTQDNGAGKTQLMVIFGSGVAQQVAIEV